MSTVFRASAKYNSLLRKRTLTIITTVKHIQIMPVNNWILRMFTYLLIPHTLHHHTNTTLHFCRAMTASILIIWVTHSCHRITRRRRSYVSFTWTSGAWRARSASTCIRSSRVNCTTQAWSAWQLTNACLATTLSPLSPARSCSRWVLGIRRSHRSQQRFWLLNTN